MHDDLEPPNIFSAVPRLHRTEIFDNSFTVEKIPFFPKDFSARFDDIEEIKVPVFEEPLEARKTVHTEYKHFTVPVLKEDVRVSKEDLEIEGMNEEERKRRRAA